MWPFALMSTNGVTTSDSASVAAFPHVGRGSVTMQAVLPSASAETRFVAAPAASEGNAHP